MKRSLVFQDLLKEFLDDNMFCELNVIMVDGHGKDERGEDFKGIYQDTLSSFWQEFYVTCKLGERERVPSIIRHDFQGDTWTAVGRIIVKGYEDLGYFPVMLSKAFVISTMFGEKEVSDDMLLHSFKQYLSKSEEQVVCEALG